MNTGELLKAVAGRIEQKQAAIGLQGVSYPALNYVPASPWAMVRMSMYRQTLVTKARAGMQVVQPGIDIVLLVVDDNSQPGDAARLDGLIEPILDLFDANANGGNVNLAFTGLLTESVDRIWHEAVVRRLSLERWGETGPCHAAIITLDSEFKREASLP